MVRACVVGVLTLTTATEVWGNPIQDENANPGTRDWILRTPVTGTRCASGCADTITAAPEIEGYAGATSVTHGDSLAIFVSSADSTFTMRIFRLGWYGGAGGREMMPAITKAGSRQPIPPTDSTTGLLECGWSNPTVIAIPATWTSGLYLAQLTTGHTHKQGYVPFVVRDDSSHAGLLFQSSVLTSQAYNCWGGKSLYSSNSTECGRAYKVSFDRPYSQANGAGQILHWEINMVRWLEREGYDVTYSTDLDTHAHGDRLLHHRGFLSVGHDEYWSWEMRTNVEQARDRGVSLGFFCANTCYWQVRLEPGTGTNTPNRVVACYKDTLLDPRASANDHHMTVTWRSRWVGRPESSMIGQMYDQHFADPGLHPNDIVIDDAASWVCRDTHLQNGDHLIGILGNEADRIFESAPRSIERIGHSPFYVDSSGIGVFKGYSDMTVYTAPSGATVFSTGSIRWSWGLDDFSGPDRQSPRTSLAAQQITRNVLDRFLAGAPPDGAWVEANDGVRIRAYPNPASRTEIEFELPRADHVKIDVVDIEGREIATLQNGSLGPGIHRREWSGRTDDGHPAPAGVYFYHLRIGARTHTLRTVKIGS